MADNPVTRWAERMRVFTSSFLAGHPLLAKAAEGASVLLHGSTTLGIDDPWSDLDGWVLAPAGVFAELRQASSDWFFDFTLDGKPGHFTLESLETFEQRVRRCDLPRIAELRHAVVLTDPTGAGQRLVDLARSPMRPEVRCGWFGYHYIEMRSEHRALDNPIERGDATAILLAMTQAIQHAMQAAMVLDSQPYPYSKWLARACSQTPTGAQVMPLLNQVLDLLAQDVLRMPGPEKQHPLSIKLREIRIVLVRAARAAGVDEPWLDRWWFFGEQVRTMREIAWQQP